MGFGGATKRTRASQSGTRAQGVLSCLSSTHESRIAY